MIDLEINPDCAVAQYAVYRGALSAGPGERESHSGRLMFSLVLSCNVYEKTAKLATERRFASNLQSRLSPIISNYFYFQRVH